MDPAELANIHEVYIRLAIAMVMGAVLAASIEICTTSLPG